MDIYSMIGEFEYPTSSQPVLGCLDSYGKKSWILVDFLVDPILQVQVFKNNDKKLNECAPHLDSQSPSCVWCAWHTHDIHWHTWHTYTWHTYVFWKRWWLLLCFYSLYLFYCEMVLIWLMSAPSFAPQLPPPPLSRETCSLVKGETSKTSCSK